MRNRLIGALAALLANASLHGQSINLPQAIFQPTVVYSTGSSLPAFAAVEFSNFPADYDLDDRTYMGWCANSSSQMIVWPSHDDRWIFRYANGKPVYDSYIENTAKFRLYNTYPNPAVLRNNHWPSVNWLINHKNGESHTIEASVIDIQEAIWYLLEGRFHDEAPFTRPAPYAPTAAAKSLVEDALRNGSEFSPERGQLVAVLLHGVSQAGLKGPPHDLIIEVTVP